METMSLRFGIDGYFYYINSVPRNNDKCKELATTEINKYKISEEGEKK